MDQARKRLIFALDVDSAQAAESWVRLLAGEVGVFKVGLELFISAGPAVVESVKRAGAEKVFLDLKLHDIPATMRQAAKAAASLGVDLITCHADQAEIFSGLDLGGAKLLGVTVLTSLDAGDLERMGYRPELTDPLALVCRRAELALSAGCSGVVCSGREAEAVRGVLGADPLVICPGIRPSLEGSSPDDQKRVVTPEKAMLAGASHIVVGRPIRAAEDPVLAARKVVEGIARGLAQKGAQEA